MSLIARRDPFRSIDPFRSVEMVARDLSRMLDRAPRADVWSPDVDVRHQGDAMIVRVDLPGVPASDVRVEVDEGVLTITGERKTDREEKGVDWYLRERSTGTFSRSIALPTGADAAAMTATFRDGVLEVTVPGLATKATPVRIPVETTAAEQEPAREPVGAGV